MLHAREAAPFHLFAFLECTLRSLQPATLEFAAFGENRAKDGPTVLLSVVIFRPFVSFVSLFWPSLFCQSCSLSWQRVICPLRPELQAILSVFLCQSVFFPVRPFLVRLSFVRLFHNFFCPSFPSVLFIQYRAFVPHPQAIHRKRRGIPRVYHRGMLGGTIGKL